MRNPPRGLNRSLCAFAVAAGACGGVITATLPIQAGGTAGAHEHVPPYTPKPHEQGPDTGE